MYFWNSYPFVRLSIALILGISSYDYFSALWKWPFASLAIGLLLYAASIFRSSFGSYYHLRHLNGLLALALIYFLGGYMVRFHYHSYDRNHYKHQDVHMTGFSGIIISPVNERTNHYRYDFEVTQVVTSSDSLIPTSGRIHLYVRKDSASLPYRYGDHLNVYGQFYPVPGPNNPNEFDYKRYLNRQDIFSHAFVQPHEVNLSDNVPPRLILQWAYALRSASSRIIDVRIQSERENGIAKALLLGIKDDLDNEVKEAYSAAGAMHVLAVSGLHVGIIFLIIKLLFGRLKTQGNWGKYTFGLLGVSIIWLYACITGLSPSVLRAATMFSLVAIGESSVREGNIYNSLGLAAFILLLFDPYLIYSVGFQLSFAAVIGIVYLQPILYQLIDFRLLILDKAWAITCVSLAAQLATFPLTAYYFHQFPTYFLVSNLVVIPASFLMLTGGVCMLLIDSLLPVAGALIGSLLEQFMWLVNELISYVHVLPHSLITWIHLDQFGLILIYLIVFTLTTGLHFRVFKTLLISTFLCLVFLGWTLLSHELQSREAALIFYEITDKTVFDYVNGHSSTLYVNKYAGGEIELLSYQIDPYRLSSHLRPMSENIQTLGQSGFLKKDVITQGMVADKTFIIIDSTTFHLDFQEVIESDIVIINNEAVKSLEWLVDHFHFEWLIIGNKNTVYYSKKMKAQAIGLGIKLHSLRTDGALKIPLEQGIKKERTIQPALFTTNPD